MTYYVPSKNIREIVGKVILMQASTDIKIDKDYLHKLLIQILEGEVFIKDE